jgi:hypothetical protein
MHRTLYLAGTSQDEDKTCHLCDEKENITHLVRCTAIRTRFWDNIALVMTKMGFTIPEPGLEREAFWLLGRIDRDSAVTPEQAGMIFIAWRCLYAEIVHARLDKAPMKIDRAFNRVWQMTITRLKAEGEKWRKWHQINKGSGRKSHYPKKYRDRKVMTFSEEAEYTIHPEIMRAYEISYRIMRKDGGDTVLTPQTQHIPGNPRKHTTDLDTDRQPKCRKNHPCECHSSPNSHTPRGQTTTSPTSEMEFDL